MKKKLVMLVLLLLFFSPQLYSYYNANLETRRQEVTENEKEVINKGRGKTQPQNSKNHNQDIRNNQGINTDNRVNDRLGNNFSEYLILVNKQERLSANFVPDDLTVPNIHFCFNGYHSKKLMRKQAARAIERLFEQAKDDNISLFGVSAYRSYSRQQAIFAYNVEMKGRAAAVKVNAQPGASEHQTGLAIDVSSPEINYKLVEQFGQTKAGIWLARTAPKYGFIIRYPKGKSQITGYQYEPWHLRYVGQKNAMRIARENLTLEEYVKS